MKISVLRDDSGLYFSFAVSEGSKEQTIEVRPDFLKRAGVGLKTDLLARAIGYKRGVKLNVLDATAGLGRDSHHLALLGCDVTAIEENDSLFQVVSEAVQKLPAAERFKIYHARAQDCWRRCTSEFDIVYLDPMFPEKKKSAKSGKETELLKLLAKPPTEDDERDLLDGALKFAKQRVVVKRPPHAPPLAGRKPDVEFEGKAVRFDVYITNK